jgi:FAD/FMN-containing dehydrogenase
VVLANGSLVVANAVSHPDLFYSLRGGAAGLGGVVTEFTARTHAPPRWVVYASVTFTTDNFTAFTELMVSKRLC